MRDGITTKYDPETDYLQVQLESGAYVNALYLGVKWDGSVLSDGAVNQKSGITTFKQTYANMAMYNVMGDGTILLRNSTTKADTKGMIIACSDNMVNLDAFNQVIITGAAIQMTWDAPTSVYVGFSDIIPNSWGSTSGKILLGMNTNFSKIIDISALKGRKYIYFAAEGNDSANPTYGKNRYFHAYISDIRCKK